MRTFSRETVLTPKCTHESKPVVVDFSDQMAYGEILAEVTSVTVTMAQGYDEVPADFLDGVASRDGSVVTQVVKDGVDGAYYRIEFLAVTDAGRTVSRTVVQPVIEL
jgi:hypothetical protein